MWNNQTQHTTARDTTAQNTEMREARGQRPEPRSRRPAGRARRSLSSLSSLLLLGAVLSAMTTGLTGCQSSHSQEAAQVAQRGSETAQDLVSYYHQMAVNASELSAGQAIREKVVNAAIPDVTPATTLTALDADALEGDYAAREAMAQNLKTLYDQFDKLAQSKPDDVIGAASKLQAAVQDINDNHPLKVSVVSGHAIPDAQVQAHLKKLISYLYDLQKAPKIQDANEKSSGALMELAAVFQAEEPVYVSNGQVFARLGYRITKSLVGKDAATIKMDVLGPTSPIRGLLAPYSLQATGAHGDVLADADKAAADLEVERDYRHASVAARAVPEGLRTSLAAQSLRQAAFHKLLDGH